MMTPTTARDLEQAIIARIQTIEPRHPVLQDMGWAPAEDNRLDGSVGRAVRAYEVRVSPGGTVDGGITGAAGVTEKALNVDVVTDYRGFDEQDLGTIATQDSWDLFESLCDVLDPGLSGQSTGIAGLTHVEDPIGVAPEDESERRMVHQLRVFYLRQR